MLVTTDSLGLGTKSSVLWTAAGPDTHEGGLLETEVPRHERRVIPSGTRAGPVGRHVQLKAKARANRPRTVGSWSIALSVSLRSFVQRSGSFFRARAYHDPQHWFTFGE